MDYNNCNGWNEYAGTYEGSYYAGDAAFARTESAGENCRSTAAAAAADTSGSFGGTSRTCDLYWQGYMAGFYANNSCNRSAEARTAARAAGRTAEASNCRCSCNNRNNCGNWNNCRS